MRFAKNDGVMLVKPAYGKYDEGLILEMTEICVLVNLSLIGGFLIYIFIFLKAGPDHSLAMKL